MTAATMEPFQKMATGKTRQLIPLPRIDDNPWQPRQHYDDDWIRELSDNIEQLGLLQAPLGRVTPSGRIQLAFGHQRVLACVLLASQDRWPDEIWMDIADLTDEEMALIALTENVRRKELSQIEVVRAHKRAIEQTQLTVQAMADKLGIDQSTLSNNLRVLELPDFVLEHVENGGLRTGVAREFLALQCTGDHVHEDDMKMVLRQVIHGDGPPDWRRRNVRRLIWEAVCNNEKDWRPIGPQTGAKYGGGHKIAGFDTDAFRREFPKSLHTIPDTGATNTWGGLDPAFEKSRVWTCEVREWSRRQSRATREANKAAADSGDGAVRGAAGNSAQARDKTFEHLLRADPVFKEIAASREEKGPSLPVSDEERKALGTRAEFKNVDYSTRFWKIIQIHPPRGRYDLDKEAGGFLPPWFPDLAECQSCTVGAAYANSKGMYPLEKPTLCCFNRTCYSEKLERGEAEYREKVEAQKKGQARQDLKGIRKIASDVVGLDNGTRRAVATALVAATEPVGLNRVHPLGFSHPDWSFPTVGGASVTDLLDMGEGLASLDQVADEDLPDLIAALTVHHLRLADKTGDLDGGKEV